MTPHRRAVRVSTTSLAAVLLFAVAACSGGHASPRSRAASLCRTALHRDIASSAATTVGDVSSLAGGPAGARIAADAFPGARASGFAAWCWTATRTRFSAYAVTDRFPARPIATYDRIGSTPPPSGAPQIS